MPARNKRTSPDGALLVLPGYVRGAQAAIDRAQNGFYMGVNAVGASYPMLLVLKLLKANPVLQVSASLAYVLGTATDVRFGIALLDGAFTINAATPVPGYFQDPTIGGTGHVTNNIQTLDLNSTNKQQITLTGLYPLTASAGDLIGISLRLISATGGNVSLGTSGIAAKGGQISAVELS
jgi:hypothetical protein